MLTEQQLKDRSTGIGGTDASAVCGESRWKTPYDVYLEKINPDLEEQVDNQYMYWGRELEPAIIKHTETELVTKIIQPTTTFRSSKHDFMIANIDGLTEAKHEDGKSLDAVIEVKTANAFSASNWGEQGTEDFPVEYKYQCAHYAYVLDKPVVYLAVLIGGNDYRLYQYNRNKDFEIKMVDKIKSFWNDHVLKQIPPADNNVNVPIIEDSFVNADEDDAEMIEELNRIKSESKVLSNREKELKNNLIAKMNGNQEMYLYGTRAVSYKSREVSRFDTVKFKSSNPLMYKKYIKKSTTNVFNLHEIKEN